MWTETTQSQYRRDGLRYASDVTDQEWAEIAALLPLPRKLGRPRATPMRQVINAMLYLLYVIQLARPALARDQIWFGWTSSRGRTRCRGRPGPGGRW